MREKWYFLSAILSLFVSYLFISKPAQALSVTGDLDNWNGTRSYELLTGSTGAVRSAPFSGTTGSIILGTGYYLYGFNIGQSVYVGDSTSSVPTYYNMVLNLNQSNTQSNRPWWRLNAASDPHSIGVSCAIKDNYGTTYSYTATLEFIGDASTGYQLSWRCKGSTSDYNQVREVRFYVGDENGNHFIGSGTPADIILVGASYAFKSGNDASSDIMNQQLRVQEQIRDGVGQATDAINNQTEYLREQNEDEREELEDNESALEDESENATEEVEENTQNLTQAIGSIIDVFKRAEPSNCKIPLNTGNFNVGEIDLCQAPNEIRTMIQIMLAIPITIGVLHIAYELLMIYVIHIRKEQE